MDYKQRIVLNLIQRINDGSVDINNAVDLLKAVFVIVNKFTTFDQQRKKEVVIETLEDIVAGRDGILYTDDDLLPKHILDGLKALIDNNMLLSTLDLLWDMSYAKTGFKLSKCIAAVCCCTDGAEGSTYKAPLISKTTPYVPFPYRYSYGDYS